MRIKSYAVATNLYLSVSALLVSFTAPNKQSFKVKSVSKSRDHVSNSQAINKFTTFFEVKASLSSFFKQLSLNSNLILELLIYISFGQTLTFAVYAHLNCSFDNPLDFHFEVVSIIPENSFVICLKY